MKIREQEQSEQTGTIKEIREIELADYSSARNYVRNQNTNYKGKENGYEIYCGLWFEPEALGRPESGERIRARYLIPVEK